MAESNLTVAVTGPTGTFGFGLMPLLQDDDRIDQVIGNARRPFDPAERGWTKMAYRQGDVRQPEDLRAAFAGADVVVHLAFLIVGGDRRSTWETNVEGTLNAYRAAADAGARRFVYASSVAAYGFHADNPVGITEDWPTRAADRLFYAQEKAELEELLGKEAEQAPDLEVYLLRPPIVLGPNAVGGKVALPGWVTRAAAVLPRRLPPVPVPVPDLPVQFIHEDDVASALVACVVADGPPGAYNIAADEVLSASEIVRLLGGLPVPLPARAGHAAARAASKLPGLPQPAQWVEALAHPAVMDTSKARELLGWSPRISARDALLETLRN